MKPHWIPPQSPFSLIQESLWRNEWMTLVVAMLLNCTNRKQVEKVLPRFMELWPEPEEFLKALDADIIALCRPLGFATRRTTNLRRMTEAYLKGGWMHARELPGIGAYGAASWEMFCRGIFNDTPPKDGALTKYWTWAKRQM